MGLHFKFEMNELKLFLETDTLEIRCPVCLYEMEEPVMTSCSHSFCRECIMACMRNKGKTSGALCPQCRTPILSKRDLKRNIALEKVIEMVNTLKATIGSAMKGGFTMETLQTQLMGLSQRVPNFHILNVERESIFNEEE